MTDNAVEQGVRSLALLAARASGADGYTFSELEPDGALVVQHASGCYIPRWANLNAARNIRYIDGVTIAAYTLRAEDAIAGQIAFAFRQGDIESNKLLILDRMAALIETVHAAPRITARLASKITRLDAELAAIKIGEKATGLLGSAQFDPDVIESIERHVASVLEGRRLSLVFKTLLSELEDRVDERRVLVRAKAILQRTRGMSEEEAYLHLLLKSRISRKRLRVVAEEMSEA